MDIQNPDNHLSSLASTTHKNFRSYFQNRLNEEGIDLTVEQRTVLSAAVSNDGVPQIEISRKVQKDKTNVTRILDLLEKKKLVIRKKDPADRRIYRIHLTYMGEKVLDKAAVIAEKVNSKAGQGLSTEELDRLKELLLKVNRNLERHKES